MNVDPLLPLTVSLGFGLLFVVAASHKLRDLVQFRAILADYQIMPESLVPVAAGALVAFEFGVGAAWIAGVAIAPAATAVLLIGYSGAIAINLDRGRTYISCGCGLAGHGDESLSGALLWRNAVLFGLTAVSWFPVSVRAIDVTDYLFAIAALAISVLVYTAANQLIATHVEMRAWRTGDD